MDERRYLTQGEKNQVGVEFPVWTRRSLDYTLLLIDLLLWAWELEDNPANSWEFPTLAGGSSGIIWFTSELLTAPTVVKQLWQLLPRGLAQKQGDKRRWKVRRFELEPKWIHSLRINRFYKGPKRALSHRNTIVASVAYIFYLQVTLPPFSSQKYRLTNKT